MSIKAMGGIFGRNPTFNTLNVESNLIAEGGITLGSDSYAAANTLDDYEEGTWTPVANNYDGSITINSATYVKIGKIVIAKAAITFSSTTDGSGVNLTGLPFSHSGADKGNSGAIVGASFGTASYMKMIGSGTINIIDFSGGNVTYTTVSGSTLNFVLTYETA